MINNKVTYIAYSLKKGGAAIAAKRQIDAMKRRRWETTYVTPLSFLEELSLYNVMSRAFNFSSRVVFYLCFRFFLREQAKCSLNLLSSKFVLKEINQRKKSIVHFHWINNETVSVHNLSKIFLSHKCVVTLHDEWFYSGYTHYIYDEDLKPKNLLDKALIDYKIKKFDSATLPFFTVPSSYMKSRATSSRLLRDARIEVVPNVIPTDIYQPKDRNFGAKYDKAKNSDIIICFGAINPNRNPDKGFDLLKAALNELSSILSFDVKQRVKLVCFGDVTMKYEFPFSTTFVGHISDPEAMAKIFAESYLTLVPSKKESFGQVAAESLGCGTPVVCFNTSGLVDIVDHNVNGYVADCFCYKDFAKGVSDMLNIDRSSYFHLCANGVDKVNRHFSAEAVSEILDSVYKKLQSES